MDLGKIINNCDIVQDLLPMYVDGSLSKDSEVLVEEHLQRCEQCREEFLRMKTDVPVAIDIPGDSDVAVDIEEAVPDTKNKGKRIIRKTVWTVVLAAFVVLIAVGGIGILCTWLYREGGKIMTREDALGTAILLIVAALLFLFLAIYMWITKRKLLSLKGRAHGTVNGLVHNGLFKNTLEGNVDTLVLKGWSVAHGEQHWGGILRMSIPPWLPCIVYTVDGKEVTQISGEGTTHNKWNLGQEITVRYDPANPKKHIIEGDNSYDWTIAVHLGCCVVLGIAAVVFILIFNML